MNLAFNNNPLIITINQPIFVRNNFQAILQFELPGIRTKHYGVYHFDGRNCEVERFYITPGLRVYGSENEAQEAARQWSDSQIRDAQEQARHIATRHGMYLVNERENHFTYGGQNSRPLRYYYWPQNADSGRRRNVQKFNIRQEALNAARLRSSEDILRYAPRNSCDPIRTGFFHFPEPRQCYFEVRFKNPEGERIKQRFKYNGRQRPSYESNEQAREAALDYIA